MAMTTTMLFFLWCLAIESVLPINCGKVAQTPYLNSKSEFKKKDQPNIILILADDMGWGDMGANMNGTSDTPNLDALSKFGLRMVDFHSGASVCAPSRAALLTGRLGLRTGVTFNFDTDAAGGLPANETTLATVLRAAGYRTAMFGKWHLGLQAGHHPMDHGFDSYLGIPYSNDMGCTDVPTGANLPMCPPCVHENDANAGWLGVKSREEQVSRCFSEIALPLLGNRDVLQQPLNLTTVTEHFSRFAKDFILRGGEASKRPFLLYAAPPHVHVPLATAPRFARTHPQPLRASLRELDWLVGTLADAARAAKRLPPYRDTLIWFMSDNGPWEVKCNLAGTAGPFVGKWQRSKAGGRGGSASKQTVWEGGHRVPAFVHWPTRIKKGRVSRALLSALDVLPTLTSLAGARIPRARHLDGEDLSALLTDDITSSQNHLPSRTLFHPNSGAAGPQGQIGAVRIGDHKVVYYSGGSPACGDGTGPSCTLHPPLVLDLSRDPGEGHPLTSHDPVAIKVRSAASAALDALHADIRTDNTSRADYSHSHQARPCCDETSAICRCPWN